MCVVNGCSGKPVGRGYCRRHYNRWYKYGDINARRAAPGLAKEYYREHCAWASMKQRCYNSKTFEYQNYGGRGIKVCDRWIGGDGFKHFLEDMGPRPQGGYSLDRINNEEGYSPENCRWADRYTQSNNRRNIISITIDGETHSLAEWCRIKNINEWTVRERVKRGWEEVDLFKPVRKMHYNR